ncbi:hypothetical protein ABZ260_35290 [Streptosporangium sp. NPDC006013]|uniref:hypothetical protein n=1 Tax=Streptosporangium sp. NPDC006013 TaxID=3155596 RepID=UPI0033B01B47
MASSPLLRLVSAALLALLAHAMAGAPAAAADPGRGQARPNADKNSIGIRLLEIPANRTDDPRSHLFIVDHVNPATTFSRRFEVHNASNEPQHLQLYAAGAGISHGRFTFAPERTPNELSSWIKLNRAAIDLPPHDRASVKATVAVPTWAPKGERYAVIWAEVSAAGAGKQEGITVVNRVGIRTYLDVGPGGEPPTDFRIGEIVPQRTEDGQPRIQATVANTGERAIDLEGQLSLSDGPSSLSAGPVPVDRGTTLAPGQQATVTIQLGEDLPDGPWKFSLTLTSGRIDRTQTGTLTFPQKSGTWGLAASTDSPLTLPLALAALVTLIAGASLLIARRFHTRRKSPAAPSHGGDLT